MRKNLTKILCTIVITSMVFAGFAVGNTWNSKKALAEENTEAEEVEDDEEEDDEEEEEVVVKLSDCKVTFDEDTHPYTGKAIKPEFTVSYVDDEGDEVDLEEDEDYEVTYSNNRKVSKNAKIKIKGITDNCTGSLVKTFTISKATQKIIAKNSKVSLTKKTAKVNAKCSTGALKYTSSKKSVATVDGSGKLTLKKKGKTIIKIKAKGSKNYKATTKKIVVTVK